MEPTPESFRARFPELCSELADEDCAAVTAALRPVEVAAGQPVVTHRDPADTLFCVVEGLLSIRIDEGGERLFLGQAGPGSVV